MFWSNCLICALTQFFKNPLAIHIHMKGRISYIWTVKRWPHFYWYDVRDNKYYHFCAEKEPTIRELWFLGQIEEYHHHRHNKGGNRFAPQIV